jgi:hypothetical protein
MLLDHAEDLVCRNLRVEVPYFARNDSLDYGAQKLSPINADAAV